MGWSLGMAYPRPTRIDRSIINLMIEFNGPAPVAIDDTQLDLITSMQH